MDKERILSQANELLDYMTEIRHDIHKFPEMGWHEVRTTDIIEREIRATGCSNIRRGFGGTTCGLICDINPDSDGPCVAIRADIDALAVAYEDNDLDYKSQVPGVMHACGHDAHAASLIGAAKIFKAMEKELPGKVRLMFQPSEEQAPTPGAKPLIAEGAIDGVDAVIGYHVSAGRPKGLITLTPGVASTSGDIWELDIIGKGGHGSRPNASHDPTIAAAHIITALQTIVSREIPPGERVVLSIGTLHSGSAVNVIPEKCEITGNIRTTNPEIRDSLPERIERIASGIASAMRCRAEFRFIPVYPCIINDLKMSKLLEESASELFGADMVKEVPLGGGSDDFNFYSTLRPSVYFNVGMGDEAPYNAAHHSPQFRTNDAVLPICASAAVGAAIKVLESIKAAPKITA